jgi:hypothetical protein
MLFVNENSVRKIAMRPHSWTIRTCDLVPVRDCQADMWFTEFKRTARLLTSSILENAMLDLLVKANVTRTHFARLNCSLRIHGLDDSGR